MLSFKSCFTSQPQQHLPRPQKANQPPTRTACLPSQSKANHPFSSEFPRDWSSNPPRPSPLWPSLSHTPATPSSRLFRQNMSSDRHHQSDSLASLWVCRDRVLNLVIYEIVFHIYFVKFFLGLVFFILVIHFVGCRGNCSLLTGHSDWASVSEGGEGDWVSMVGDSGGWCPMQPPKMLRCIRGACAAPGCCPRIRFAPALQSFSAFFASIFFPFFFFFFVWVVETLVILSMAAAFGAAYPRKYPQSGAHPAKSVRHFGTPFSHKHFNEKYQRNCFWNCFICHKQNACQISLMLFMCILWRMRPHPLPTISTAPVPSFILKLLLNLARPLIWYGPQLTASTFPFSLRLHIFVFGISIKV